jgi:inorganic pyrophosphatase
MEQFQRFRPHPWHGLEAGPNPPESVFAYIEITPFDLIKYEIHKESGYLMIDRPQRSSAQPPTLYGFIPKTYCGERVSRLSPSTTGGDGDPLDICVISERAVVKSEVLVICRPIGGLQTSDRSEADDKIIAVLEGDYVWGDVTDISGLPSIFLERLHHYFSTYKLKPGTEQPVNIKSVYGFEHARAVINAAIEDYREKFESVV